jgi:hypothetical protein
MSTQNRTTQPTEKQRAMLATLQKNFGLSDGDRDRCLFFSQDQDRPYIPPELLISIARSTQHFQSIDPEYSTYVEALKQLIYKATVVDIDGRAITRIGVATIGEKPNGYDIDTHKLAEGRALGAALSDSGFNPFKTGSIAAIGIMEFRSIPRPFADERASELDLLRRDLAQIHILAAEKELSVQLPSGQWDKSNYRNWLLRNFGVHSASLLTEEQRAQVINLLRLYEPDNAFLAHIPVELREDAMVA